MGPLRAEGSRCVCWHEFLRVEACDIGHRGHGSFPENGQMLLIAVHTVAARVGVAPRHSCDEPPLQGSGFVLISHRRGLGRHRLPFPSLDNSDQRPSSGAGGVGLAGQREPTASNYPASWSRPTVYGLQGVFRRGMIGARGSRVRTIPGEAFTPPVRP